MGLRHGHFQLLGAWGHNGTLVDEKDEGKGGFTVTMNDDDGWVSLAGARKNDGDPWV